MPKLISVETFSWIKLARDVQIYFYVSCDLEKELECFYCEGGVNSTEVCNDYHPGQIVSCQTQDPNGDHYGHTCAIGHTG